MRQRTIHASAKRFSVILAVSMVGCAGPLDRGAFDDWTRTDQKVYAGRYTELAVTADHDVRRESPEQSAPGPALNDHIHYALGHNPALEAAFLRWRAAVERIPQARALPNPQVSFGIVLDEVDREVDYMGERYAISQMFPWFGTLSQRGEVAFEEARAAAARYEAMRLELVSEVTEAWFEYAYLHEALAIMRENRDLLQRIEAVTLMRFRTGAVNQADVNRAQIELARLDEQVRSMQDMVGTATAALNAAMGRPAHTPLPEAPARPTEQVTLPLPDHTDAHWLAMARQHNADLAGMRRDAASQRQAISLARRDYYPDVMVSVEYARGGSARMAMMDGGGADMLMGMVSVSLPIWRSSLEAGVHEAIARFGEATRQIQEQENRLDVDVKRALFNYRDSQRKLELYSTTLLPKARQTLATTEAGYRAGEMGFTDLIEAQRVLLEFELSLQRAAADRAQALARLRTLAGPPEFEDATATIAGHDERIEP